MAQFVVQVCPRKFQFSHASQWNADIFNQQRGRRPSFQSLKRSRWKRRRMQILHWQCCWWQRNQTDAIDVNQSKAILTCYRLAACMRATFNALSKPELSLAATNSPICDCTSWPADCCSWCRTSARSCRSWRETGRRLRFRSCASFQTAFWRRYRSCSGCRRLFVQGFHTFRKEVGDGRSASSAPMTREKEGGKKATQTIRTGAAACWPRSTFPRMIAGLDIWELKERPPAWLGGKPLPPPAPLAPLVSAVGADCWRRMSAKIFCTHTQKTGRT